jgi:hypothetical protein
MGRPVFSHVVPLTGNCLHHCTGFRNNYFGTKMTIPAGTLKPGRLYMIGIYGSNLPHPGEEDYNGSLLTSAAQFLPVRSGQPSDNQPNPDQPVARPDLYIPHKRINPYQEMNTLTARVSGLPKLTEGYYRFSVQATDIFGELTGEKALEQVIPVERIHDGAAEEKLNVPGSTLNYEGSYRVVLEKVIPGKDGAADTVEPVASENLDLLANTAEEQKAAVEWVKQQALLDESKTVLSRRDVTVALYRLAGSPKVELPATSPYGDITPDDPDYAAYIWARQQGVTFGWIDGNFHPDAQLSTRSIVAFLYRYQRSRGKVSPILPTAEPQPRNGSLPGSKDSELSTKYWATDLNEGSAFWSESRWAVQQHIWGYAEDWLREDFTWPQTTTYDLAVMLYRMAQGGSRLR